MTVRPKSKTHGRMTGYPEYETSVDLRAIDLFHAWLRHNQDHRMILQPISGLDVVLMIIKEVKHMEEVPPLQVRMDHHNQPVGHLSSGSLLESYSALNKYTLAPFQQNR